MPAFQQNQQAWEPPISIYCSVRLCGRAVSGRMSRESLIEAAHRNGWVSFAQDGHAMHICDHCVQAIQNCHTPQAR